MAKKNTKIYMAAFALFVCATGYLCFEGLGENSVYFLNVAEARAAGPEKLGQARLFGLVSEHSLDKNINSISFQLVDKDDAMLAIPVVYHGPVPDTFKVGAEVIVEGGMNGNGRFSAKKLMTKCPSKYQKENRQTRL